MSSPSPVSSPPPTNTTAPPPTNTTAPPPTPSVTPPPAPSTTPPPTTTPSAPPPTTPTPPPPSTPSSPPPPTSTPTPPSTTPSPPSPPSTTPSPPSPPSTTPSSPSPPSKSPPTHPTPPSPSRPSGPSPKSGGGGGGGPSPGNGGAGSGVSSGVVIGAAIAGVAVLVVVSIICVCCFRKKKRRRDDNGGGVYYIPPPAPLPGGPTKDGQYGVQPQQQWQQNYPPPAEHYQIPKPPPAATAGGLPRPPPRLPSPQPLLGHAPFMSSGGGSGSSVGSESQLPPPSPGLSLGFSKSTFTYDELAMATDHFSESRILGQGGFGYVHKGILPNGKEVAVKSLKANSGQGEREFQAEVEIISRVHHKHLVSLVGYCITGSHRLLVYEFVPNRTMEYHLHAKGQTPLDWPTRLRIALGSAKGLAYLHEDCHPKIIHRDIKAANILLDFKFEAKVADFGLAKFSSDVNTHVSTRVMGTFGYLAPEYAASGKLSDKSDVFSYGVMLLELITGRRPVDATNTYMDDSLVDWARPLLTRSLEENNFDSLVDKRLQNNYNPNEMARMVACAAACVRHSARRRPRMSQVVRALEGEVSLSDLNEGIKPGHSAMYSSYGSSDYDSGQQKEDLIKFRQALASQEYGSSEYGGTTSEYGMYPSGSSSEAASCQTTRDMELGKMKGDSKGFSGSSAV